MKRLRCREGLFVVVDRMARRVTGASSDGDSIEEVSFASSSSKLVWALSVVRTSFVPPRLNPPAAVRLLAACGYTNAADVCRHVSLLNVHVKTRLEGEASVRCVAWVLLLPS